MNIPKQGDIISIDLPELGKGRRGNVLVLSIVRYNASSELMVAAPILPKSSQIKEIKPNILIDKHNIVLADQIRSVNYKQRNAQYIGTVDGKVLLETLSIIAQVLALK